MTKFKLSFLKESLYCTLILAFLFIPTGIHSSPFVQYGSIYVTATEDANKINPVCQGDNITFRVFSTAVSSYKSDEAVTYTYQWEKKAYCGAVIQTMCPISGQTGITFTTGTAGQYQCRYQEFTDGVWSGEYTTGVATVQLVGSGPTDIVNLSSYTTLCKDNSVTLTTSASGSYVGYQWQRQIPPATSWTNLSGKTETSYTFTPPDTYDGFKYRCNIWNVCDENPTSATELRIKFQPVIVSSPQSSKVCCPGENRDFAMTASGKDLIYRWQIQDGSGWKNISNTTYPGGESYTGATTNHLYMTNIQSGNNGYIYRCRVDNSCGIYSYSGTSLLTVKNPVTVSSHPISIPRCEGGIANFSITASGTAPIHYKWEKVGDSQFSAPDQSSLQISSVSAADAGNYKCLISNDCATNISSNVASLTVKILPEIQTDPVDVPICEGEVPSVSFTSNASGSDLTYAWEISTDEGQSYVDVVNTGKYSGALTGTLTITGPDASMDQYRFRLRAEGYCEPDAISSPALLTVHTAAAVTSNPVSLTRCTGEGATMAISATGTPPLQYLWRKDGSTVPGGPNAASYTIENVTGSNGGNYDCVVSNACNPSGDDSEDALLTVKLPPSITSHPVDIQICEGVVPSVSFAASASGSDLIYVWEFSPDDGEHYMALEDTGKYSGSGTGTLTIADPEAGMNQYKYRLRLTGYCSSDPVSNPGTLTVHTASSITSNPVSLTRCTGEEAILSVSATGTPPLQYLWRKDGSTLPGAPNAPTFSIDHVSTSNGGNYDCVVSNTCNPSGAESEVAVLAIKTPPAISVDPTDITICEGSLPSVSFSATAGGSNLVYAWQLSSDNGENWSSLEATGKYSGVNTGTLTISGPDASMDQQLYRLALSGFCSPAAISDSAKLNINTAPAITHDPEDRMACVGAEVRLSSTASGSEPIQYLWKRNGVTIPDWSTDSTLLLPGVSAGNAGTYSVLVKNMCSGTPIESDEAILTVNIPPAINSHPQDISICAGSQNNVTFSTTVPGSGFSYLWEYSTDGEENWTDLSNEGIFSNVTTDELTVASTADSMDNYIFRCKIVGVCEPPVTTESATLNIKTGPKFVTHPQADTICQGEDVTFSVEVTGTEPFQYRWTGGNTVSEWTSQNTFTITGAALSDIDDYSVKVKNECSETGEQSDEAGLVVHPAPYISLGDDRHLCTGESMVIDAILEYPAYSWSTGDTTKTTEVNQQGNYTVTVTDLNGCKNSDNVFLILDPVLPDIDLGGDRQYCSGESVILDAGSGFDSYSWQDASNAQTFSVVTTGEYSVTVSRDYTVCNSTDAVSIIIAEPYEEEKICLITIDIQTGRNMIIWEKNPDMGTVAYRLYRETNKINEYEVIATLPYDDLSIYKDLEADPEKQQWIYKLTAVDSCENESDIKITPYHKPIFLQYNSSDDGVNLSWEKYEVEGSEMEFVTYEIYRGTDSTGLDKVDDVAASKRVYKDTDPVALASKMFYRVAGVKADPCYPAAGKKADGYQHSMSNLEDNKIKGDSATAILNQAAIGELEIWPNPWSDYVSLRFKNPEKTLHTAYITDISGKAVRIIRDISSDEFIMDRSNLKAGYYFVEIRGKYPVRGKMIVR